METLLNKIIEQQSQMVDLLKNIAAATRFPDGDNRFITSFDVMADLQISRTVFNKLKTTMPLFRLGHGGDYRMRLLDYKKWKKKHFQLT
jgi:hypothetical protein